MVREIFIKDARRDKCSDAFKSLALITYIFIIEIITIKI